VSSSFTRMLRCGMTAASSGSRSVAAGSPASPASSVSGTPAEVAARAGNSARVLHEVYLHCINGQEDLVSQRIEDTLEADASSRKPVTQSSVTGSDLPKLPTCPVKPGDVEE